MLKLDKPISTEFLGIFRALGILRPDDWSVNKEKKQKIYYASLSVFGPIDMVGHNFFKE